MALTQTEELEFLLTLDHAGRITGIPPDAAGPTADALRAKFGRPLSEACTLRDVQRLDAVIRNVLMGKSAAPAQAEITAPGGQVRECVFRFTPLHAAPGKTTGVVVQVQSGGPAKSILTSLPGAVLGRLMGVAKNLNLLNDTASLALAVTKAARVLCNADATGVFLLDRFTGLLRVGAHTGFPPSLENISINHGEGTVGRVLATGRLTWEARRTAELPATDPVAVLGAQSFVHVPLALDGNTAGVLSVFATGEDQFNDMDVKVLTGLAEMAAAGLHRATERYDLARAEASNSMILMEAPLGIVAFDTEGRVTHANPEFVRLTRLDCQNPRNLLGRNVFSLPVVLQNRLSQTLVGLLKGEGFRQEIEQFALDDDHRAYEIQGRPLRNEAGIVVGAVVLVRDIQRRLEATHALQVSEGRYRSLFETSRDGLFVFSPDFAVVDANPAAAELVGVRREDLRGMTAGELYLSGEQGRDGRSAFKTLKTDGRLSRTEVALRRRDGQGFPAEINGVRLADEHYLVSARDISDRAELEAQVVHSQKMEAVGTLAGGVAHDFNNLLGGIMGYASLLREEMELRPETRLAIDSILSATQAARQRTSQLLAFARGGKYQVRPVNLVEMLEGLREVISHSLSPRISIKLDAPGTAVTVMGDSGQLTGALMNLLVNAKDAVGEEGRITVTLKTRQFREDYTDGDTVIQPGQYARIEIEDTGQGIPRDVLDKIFEPYYTTKGAEKASGLGLSVVLGVVEHHEGFVAVDSVEGRGTRFRVYLPLVGKTVFEAQPLPPPVARSASRANERRRILVAEDEVMLRTLAENVLSKSGFDVMVAEDGLEAVDIFEREKGQFDLVLLDLVMPRMSGDAAFARMRGLRPDIPVLLSSGYSKDSVAQDLFTMGAAGFLEKPYDITQLLDAVYQVIGE